jgi:FKBP-type peptidyl-prolyl cis-trans isomerase FkpA
MKKAILFVSAAVLFIAGCRIDGDDNCVTKTIASEQAKMEALATSQGMTWSQHSSGILFQVVNPGAGMTASSTSKIFVKYEGRLESGVIFETQTDHTQTGWVLGGMIAGWQIAVPLIQEGGKIRVVIPSSLAYGCGFRGNIPSNAILYFDIDLVDVQ